jgi:hypothetical protein
MANISKIPPDLEGAISTLLGQGRTEAEVREWLYTEHKIDCSHSSVHRFCVKVKSQRKEVAKQVYAAAIAKTAFTDIEVLAENTEILRNLRDKAVTDNNASTIIRTCSELKSHVALKMSVSGVNTQETDEQAKDELLDIILKQEDREVEKAN